jgi:beta-mannosidase
VLVSARRTGEESVGSINRQVNKVTGCDIYTVSDSVAPVRTTLRWTLYHLDGRKLLAGSRKVLLRYGQSVVQKKLDLHREFAKYGKESIYLHVYLTGQSAILSQNTVFFTSMRFVDLPREKLNPLVKKVGSGQFRLVFRSKTYQHMVAVDVAGIGFRMSDNWFDLYPGIPHAVELSVEKDCTAQQLRKRMSVVSLADSY